MATDEEQWIECQFTHKGAVALTAAWALFLLTTKPEVDEERIGKAVRYSKIIFSNLGPEELIRLCALMKRVAGAVDKVVGTEMLQNPGADSLW